ncbi:MAG: hypothetical protein WC548_02835 [Candidatus Pacearchaeota archaeon]
MKKIGMILIFCFIFPLILAENSTNTEKISEGFSCLEEKVEDCSELTNQEIALTILATPSDDIFDKCVSELKERKSEDNWGNVRDTALAVLALNHAGENTQSSEEWLIEQSETPSDLVWYIEEDSSGETECHVGHESSDYIVNIGENKKIDKDAGPCLTRTQSNYWFLVSSDCYDQEFKFECNQDFIATLLYKNRNSPTLYVLEETKSSPAYGTISLKVNSKCFGDSKCDYEASLWAALALLETGHNIEEYIPYIIAMSDTNKQYLPDSFIYILTNYEGYASRLITKQKLGNYWEAESSAYGRYYDTSLAFLSIDSSSEQLKNSKDWLLFSQGNDGCWQNIRNTAIVLWALEKKPDKIGGNSVSYCTSSNYFCVSASNCPTSEVVAEDYFCPFQSDVCCMTENLKSCTEYSGQVCDSDEVCTGNEKKATDTSKCCTGECAERPIETECESMYYSCSGSCSDAQEQINYDCGSGQVCCRTISETKNGSIWTWIILIIFIIALIIILWIYREKLKLIWFKFKTKYRKDKSGSSSRGMPPGGPSPGSMQRYPPQTSPYSPKPGFPPIRRMPIQMSSQKPYNPEDKSMSDVFNKLKDMSK